jgi:hypothetical protein
MHARPAALVVASLLLLLVALPASADQKIKTKSNIKNDRVASTCTQDCAAAGHAWASENKVTDPAACDSSSAAFTEGCKAYVKEQSASSPASN